MVIRCHSSFAHYNMFHNSHRHCGGDNYGSIFNIKYNCSGGHTNFWGGLGFGLGAGLGNWCGGWLNNIMGGMGNWFSPFGAMMPGIMQSFGYGGFNMPWASNYSNYDRFSKYDSGNGKLYNGNPCNCKQEVNTDAEAIDALYVRFSALNEDSSEEDINGLKSDLVSKWRSLDGVEDNIDKSRIETMLTHLPKRKAGEVEQPAEGEEVEEEDSFDPIDDEFGCQNVSTDVGAPGETKVYSLPSVINYNNLKKLEGYVVAPQYNAWAAEDKYIYGKIQNVQQDENNITFEIDCRDYSSKFGLTYTVTIPINDASKATFALKDGQTAPTDYTAKAQTRTWDANKKMYIATADDHTPVISKYHPQD